MSLKIYFCGSIRGGRQDQALYHKIIGFLESYGTVLTEHVGQVEEKLKKTDGKMTDKEIHDRDVDWLQESDVVVAEVTQPSLGVGYEIGRAVAMKKKTLCLFRPSEDKRLSAMIEGAANGTTFKVQHYQEPQVENLLKAFFQQEL